MGHGHFRTILIAIFLLAVPLVSATSYVPPPPIKEVAFLDVDGDSVDEIVVSLKGGGSYTVDIYGNMKERPDEIVEEKTGILLPEWVDLDGDGSPEYLNITSDGIVASNENGTLRWEFNKQIANATASDLDHDGNPEIIYTRPKQYPDTLGILDSRGNLKFEVNTDTIRSERSRIRQEKEDRDILMKTLAMVATSFLLAWFSSDARKFLKPNKQKVGLTFLFGLLITIPIGGGPLVIPIPVLMVFVLSIVDKQLGYFPASVYLIFGAYLFACITFVIFERYRQPIKKAVIPFVILCITALSLALAGVKGAQNVLMTGMLVGFWLWMVLFYIIPALFILMVLYYIAKMIQTKFRRS